MSEKALKNIRKLSYPDRDTHVPRSGYACTSVGVRMYFGRGTHVLRSRYDDNEAFLRRLSGEKEKTKHVKRENNSCEKEKANRLRGF